MIDRRHFIKRTAIGLAAPFVLRHTARAADVTLRLQQFLPAGSPMQRRVLQPWASEVQAASDGRIEILILAPMQRAVTPPPFYEQVREGKVDIAVTMAGHNPGRFARLEVFELPFVAGRSGIVNARAAQEFTDKHAAEEFPDVRPLGVWSEDHGVLHAKKQIVSQSELRGTRICPQTRLCGRALEALGAIPVFVSAAQMAEGLTQNILDGSVAGWDAASALKLDESTGFHTEIAGSPTLSSAVSMLIMNKAKFDAMPEELQRILVERSGRQVADLAGATLDARSGELTEIVRERSHPVLQLGEPEKAAWIAATQPVVDAWVAEMQQRGIDGAGILREARAIVAKHDLLGPDGRAPDAEGTSPLTLPKPGAAIPVPAGTLAAPVGSPPPAQPATP